jgi:arylsulfatase A-like enzyme
LDRHPFGLGRPLSDKFNTLAEILSQKGYAALAIVANHAYVSDEFGLAQGFEYFDQRSAVPFLWNFAFYCIRQSVSEIAGHFTSPRYLDKAYRSAEEINDATLSVLDELRRSDKPFFLFINYMDAHWPFMPPAPFDHLLPGKNPKFGTRQYTAMTMEVMKLERKVTVKERDHLVSQYDGGIAYLDSEIGKLIARLKELDLYENSLLIITSDHGESFGRRNFVGHIVSVYQDQIHVPLIIKYPNTNQSVLVQDFVSLVDLMPTILDVLEFSPPGNIDGRSLLKHSADKSRPVIAESYPGSWEWNLHPRFHRVERAIFSGPYKFVLSTAGKRELYNLSNDPNEKTDLSGTDSETSRRLEAEINQWAKSAESGDTEAASASKLDTDTINRLKSLGYVK